ncbi:hypothetical protein AGMMS49960_11810 [Betaproteobacteria bacterium]|nr:hypothetical protein AGMMS49543_26050 [Betaproteobacteria bacterium]GHU01492.1 hypothetical protein AGMMS49960_11810 [Betaproteobacteria bacterium]GHU09006.1 hypothetical protein AGMMS50225_08750 [Betaproteobacteria bacterium]GHU16590.1 hypothetical protein AGMMS50243_03070 [Betaproteobacteria bacterium]
MRNSSATPATCSATTVVSTSPFTRAGISTVRKGAAVRTYAQGADGGGKSTRTGGETGAVTMGEIQIVLLDTMVIVEDSSKDLHG